MRTLILSALILLTPVLAWAVGDPVAGKVIYETQVPTPCATCHGGTGGGEAETGFTGAAAFSSADYTIDTEPDGMFGTDADLTNVITNGAAFYGGLATMLAQGLNAQETEDVIAYIRTLEPVEAEMPVMPDAIMGLLLLVLFVGSWRLIRSGTSRA